jgi:hypothetical protein
MHYLLIHQIQQYPSTQEAWIESWREVLRRCSAETRWLHSFLDTSNGKLYCEWEARDLESILACFGPESLVMAPLEYHSEIVYFDTAWLDEG